MMYYIDKVNTWSAANRKCLEVQSFAKEFRQTLRTRMPPRHWWKSFGRRWRS